MDCQKYFARLQKMKNTQSKIKPIKTGKKLRKTYCLGCKDFTHKLGKNLEQRIVWGVKNLLIILDLKK